MYLGKHIKLWSPSISSDTFILPLIDILAGVNNFVELLKLQALNSLYLNFSYFCSSTSRKTTTFDYFSNDSKDILQLHKL